MILHVTESGHVGQGRTSRGDPLHPYSQLLINSLPSIEHKGVLKGIPGLPPSLLDRPVGCAFRARCPFAFERCEVEDPPLREVRPNRLAACHLYGGGSLGETR